MNPDPLSIALREVTDCKRLLETLITSSESFDYPQAKVALKQLNKKLRELGKLQTALAHDVADKLKVSIGFGESDGD